MNIPLDDPNRFDRARDGRDGNKVIDSIDRRMKVLADKTQPRERRAEALKFVVHLIAASAARI